MLKHRRIIQDSARKIADAANRTVGDDILDDADRQPDITAILLGKVKRALDGYKIRNVKWTAKTLSRPAPKAEEETLGADLLGIVEFDLPEFRVKTCFLAHTWRIERGQAVSPPDWDRLAKRCKVMLSMTAESFVFVCARTGISIVPALTITSASAPRNPHDFYGRTALRFYEDHFECFVGDGAISSFDIATLEQLKARHAIYLNATSIEQVEGLQMELGPIP
jgi:hypothetical protein